MHIESFHKGETVKCDYCDSAFSRKGYLISHIESVHDRKKPFKYNVCDAAFSHKTNMKVPIESVHKGNKPFKCKECDLSFSQKGNLNRHATVHETFCNMFCNI